MSLKEKGWIIMKWSLLAFVVVASTLGGCQYVNKKLGLENDNVCEQLVEEYIEKETGFELDLTP